MAAELEVLAARAGCAVSLEDACILDVVLRPGGLLREGCQQDAEGVATSCRQLPQSSTLCSASAYVYDLQTVGGTFGVTPGDLVVHNTDSVTIHWGVHVTCSKRFGWEKLPRSR